MTTVYYITYKKAGQELTFESTSAEKPAALQQYYITTGMDYEDITGFHFKEATKPSEK